MRLTVPMNWRDSRGMVGSVATEDEMTQYALARSWNGPHPPEGSAL
jgi:hypothetical protein